MKAKKKIRDNFKGNERFKKYIPSLITSIRIIFLPLFLYIYFMDLKMFSFFIFLILSITDLIDGYIARIMGVASSWGANFDIIADFILILVVFAAFFVKGIYPLWMLLLIIFMFLQFILSSKIKIPVYDPVGKYFGTVLFASILLTLLFENTVLYLSIFILLFALISIFSRYMYLFLKWRKNKRFK